MTTRVAKITKPLKVGLALLFERKNPVFRGFVRSIVARMQIYLRIFRLQTLELSMYIYLPAKFPIVYALECSCDPKGGYEPGCNNSVLLVRIML